MTLAPWVLDEMEAELRRLDSAARAIRDLLAVYRTKPAEKQAVGKARHEGVPVPVVSEAVSKLIEGPVSTSADSDRPDVQASVQHIVPHLAALGQPDGGGTAPEDRTEITPSPHHPKDSSTTESPTLPRLTKSDQKRAARVEEFRRDEERRREIAAACKNTPMTMVAERFGVCVGTVRKCRDAFPDLSADDPEPASRQSDEAAIPGQRHDAAFAEAAELYAAGVPTPEIAAQVGYGVEAIATWAARNDWDRPLGHRTDAAKARWKREGIEGKRTGKRCEVSGCEKRTTYARCLEHRREQRKAEGEDDDEGGVLGESPGLAFLRHNPPPRSFTPSTEPGWLVLASKDTPPPLPPPVLAIAKETPQRRCWCCGGVTSADPCSLCSRPWQQPGIAMGS